MTRGRASGGRPGTVLRALDTRSRDHFYISLPVIAITAKARATKMTL